MLPLLSSAIFRLQNRDLDFFYQGSLGNDVDFRYIMNVSQISWLKIKISKN